MLTCLHPACSLDCIRLGETVCLATDYVLSMRVVNEVLDLVRRADRLCLCTPSPLCVATGMTFTSMRGRLLLFGGSGTSAKCFNDLQIFDPQTMAWYALLLPILCSFP
jgi:hypothetical protein